MSSCRRVKVDFTANLLTKLKEVWSWCGSLMSSTSRVLGMEHLRWTNDWKNTKHKRWNTRAECYWIAWWDYLSSDQSEPSLSQKNAVKPTHTCLKVECKSSWLGLGGGHHLCPPFSGIGMGGNTFSSVLSKWISLTSLFGVAKIKVNRHAQILY